MDAYYYLLRDAHGQAEAVVVTEPSDTVHVCGLKNTAGETLHFESDAYHLRKWAADNGMEFRKCIKRHTFEELWKAAE